MNFLFGFITGGVTVIVAIAAAVGFMLWHEKKTINGDQKVESKKA
jgi:hypothetical protein